MSVPFVIDNNEHRLSSVLNDLLPKTEDRPFDVATAYFAVSGYRLVKDSLHKVGAFRLLLGSEPHSGTDLGLRADTAGIKARLQGDLEAEPFNEETLRASRRRLQPEPRGAEVAAGNPSDPRPHRRAGAPDSRR